MSSKMKTFNEFINEGQHFLRSIGKNDTVSEYNEMSLEKIVENLKSLKGGDYVIFQNDEDDMFYKSHIPFYDVVIMPERTNDIKTYINDYECDTVKDLIDAITSANCRFKYNDGGFDNDINKCPDIKLIDVSVIKDKTVRNKKIVVITFKFL